jgi:hypothetical protein
MLALRALTANAGPTSQAVNYVVGQLNLTRQARGPAHFGQIVEPNAHLAARSYAVEVEWRIRFALLKLPERAYEREDAAAMARLADITAALDPEFVTRHLHERCESINLEGLPDTRSIFAEVTLEASVAAANNRQEGARPKNDTSTDTRKRPQKRGPRNAKRVADTMAAFKLKMKGGHTVEQAAAEIADETGESAAAVLRRYYRNRSPKKPR